MSSWVVDASALLAAINGEPGGDVLGTIADDLIISSVNISEVVARLAERGALPEFIRGVIQPFNLTVRPFDVVQAYEAGMLRPATKALGLSFGDRACIALALVEGLPLLTAERAWQNLQVGVQVRLIR